MRLFLDTEFADQEAKELVSLALVSEDGKKQFYAEREPLPARATPFVQQYVYPLLDRGSAAMDVPTFTKRLRAFLLSVDAPHVIYDFPDDLRLLRHAIHGFDLPSDVADSLGQIQEVEGTLTLGGDVMRFAEAWFAEHPQAKRHHALVDAHALRIGWLKANG
jgi:hypothetical protein